MARNEVSGPEPDRQRRAAPLHDRASSQRVIPLTFAAPQNLQPVGEAVGFAGFAAPSAHEPLAPADWLQGKQRKPYRQERDVGTRAVNPEMADPRGARRRRAWRHLVSTATLPIVGLGVNRISTVQTIPDTRTTVKR